MSVMPAAAEFSSGNGRLCAEKAAPRQGQQRGGFGRRFFLE